MIQGPISFTDSPLTPKEAIVQPTPPAEISRQRTNLFSATEVAETIGADLETINAWLEVGDYKGSSAAAARYSRDLIGPLAIALCTTVVTIERVIGVPMTGPLPRRGNKIALPREVPWPYEIFKIEGNPS